MNLKTIKITEADFLEYKKRHIARKILNKAIRDGEIERSKVCEICLSEAKTSAHHIDYGQPLKVLFLCDSCHGETHRKHHPLNPNNYAQTRGVDTLMKTTSINVGFTIPFKNFVALKKKSIEEKRSISSLMRLAVLSEYAVDDGQLTLNL